VQCIVEVAIYPDQASIDISSDAEQDELPAPNRDAS